jgi:hypothetical protein
MTSKEVEAVLVEMKLRGDKFESYYSLLIYRGDLYTSYIDALEAKAFVGTNKVQSSTELHDLYSVVWAVNRLHAHDLICLVESGNGYVLPYDEAFEWMNEY